MARLLLRDRHAARQGSELCGPTVGVQPWSGRRRRRAEVEVGGAAWGARRREVGQRFGLVFSGAGAASRRAGGPPRPSLAAAVCTCCCVPYHA
jgi:hypothetical protein